MKNTKKWSIVHVEDINIRAYYISAEIHLAEGLVLSQGVRTLKVDRGLGIVVGIHKPTEALMMKRASRCHHLKFSVGRFSPVNNNNNNNNNNDCHISQ
jgi:hypothetical protein